jgi:hypothetical protein
MSLKEEVQHDQMDQDEHAQLKALHHPIHGMVGAAHLFQGLFYCSYRI